MKTKIILIDGIVSKKLIRNTQDWSIRKAVRAVLFGENKKIPLLWSEKYKFHKIPGGGIEKGETLKKALKREIIEEVGAKIKSIKQVGIIKEYWTKNKYYQESFCFTAKIKNIIKDPVYTEDEKSAGMELRWYHKSEAIEKMDKDEPEEYKKVNFRDKLLLKRVLS